MSFTGLDIINAYEAIEQALNRLCLHIHDGLVGLPVWVDNGSQALSDERDNVIYALKRFTGSLNEPPQVTFACVGAVAATEHTLTLVALVNQAKAAFREILTAYLGPVPKSRARDTAAIRELLAHHGYPGIKLKLVTRHLKMVAFHPRRISFTTVRNNSYRLITHQEAEQQLTEKGQGLHIEVQRAKLSLVNNQSPLAIRWDNPPNWVANVATFKDKAGHSKTTKIPTSLPLFYLHDPKQPTPLVVFSRKQQCRKAKARADKRVEEQPFLKSLRAFRVKS